jgi:3-dehydroquinate dehydratase/shikimate dehydrogenase
VYVVNESWMGTLVCETVTATTMAELRAARDAVKDADLVELRLDGVADLDVAGALAGRRRPVIVTCRPSWEGGKWNGFEAKRLEVLADAIRLGAEYVDVEWRADRRSLPANERSQRVLSHHDFHGVPTDLAARVRAMRAERPAVLKIAVSASRLSDCLTLRDAVAGGSDHVAIAMGATGQLTRVWPAWLGSLWMYGGAAAPGQLSTRELVDVFRIRRTSNVTRVFGLTGAPLGHSASPAMHNAAFASLGLDAVYVPLETTSADEFLNVAREISLAGASVTAPLKESLFALATAADDTTRDVRAVNTLRRGPRGWEGRNFDIAGFHEPLARRKVSLRGKRAVVLGAGGGARAAAFGLKQQGASVEVSARRTDRARVFAGALGVEAGAWPPAGGWDVLVNATPVGTWPKVDASPLSQAALCGRLVYDLVYNPQETTLLKAARAAGIETIGGLEMLVAQACLQCQWWTGVEAPATVIDRAARERLASPR